jgi:transcriptional regulator with XRE-family HTH domain
MEQEWLPGKLRVLRAQQGLTLVEAAERIGIGRDTLSDLERGRRHPVMPTLAKIAQGYGVPVEELLEPVEEMAAPKAPSRPSPEPEEELEETEEERRERLRDYRELMERALSRLESLYKETKNKDGRKLVDTTVLTVFAAMGAQQFVDREVGEPRDAVHDRSALRVYSTLARYDDLMDDLVEAVEAAPEAEAEVISLLERLQSREAG